MRQMYERRLGDVVRDLRLREIDPVRRYTRYEDDGPTAARGYHTVVRDRLGAKKSARGVDVKRAPPLRGGHVCRGRAAYDAGKAA